MLGRLASNVENLLAGEQPLDARAMFSSRGPHI
jgi:hypothetical protein